VHSGALGWVAMVSIGAMYHLIPLLYGRDQGQMYSVKLINLHFWLATLGTVLYIASMWVNGLLQGLMWRATSVDGTLTYSFAEAVEASYPGHYVRFIGGSIFLIGMLIMAFNVYKTVRGERRTEEPAPATPLVSPEGAKA
jgi:cytochrome c oxidase cbb3-type subunit 1